MSGRIDEARAALGFSTKPPGAPNPIRVFSINGGEALLVVPLATLDALDACAIAGLSRAEALRRAREALGRGDEILASIGGAL